MTSANSSQVSSYAPGRVELLGNHTDYNGGVVLAAAIDRGMTVSGGQRDDGLIVLEAEDFGKQFQTKLTELQPQKEEAWANYALGVVDEFRKAGLSLPAGGFTARVTGNIPVGGGLSSSAAFEVATAGFLLKLTGQTLPPIELAKLCQRAENHFVGVKSGLLDQATSVFGRAHQAVFLDCRSEEVRNVPFPKNLALVIADSGKKHALIQGEYNERREQCEAAAKALGVKLLREVTSAQLEAAANLDPLLKQRARHIVGENERVQEAVALLAAGDGAGFGRLMDASHESSRVNFENSSAELDILVELARPLPGVLGARLSGGGFGGATVTLVEAGQAAQVAVELAAAYERETSIKAQIFVCQIADGAVLAL